jgi:hypothetical protein
MGISSCGDGEMFPLAQTALKQAVPTTEGGGGQTAAARHRTRGRWVFFVGAVRGCHPRATAFLPGTLLIRALPGIGLTHTNAVYVKSTESY